MTLTPHQKKILLVVARESMEAAVLQKPSPDIETSEAALLEPKGAFVTLWIGEELRGCVGYFEPLYRLTESVAKAAVKAAIDDRRFPPVGPDELSRIRLEISVLSGRIPLESAREIVVGRDGLFLETDTAHGVLLPQVAEEYGWDAETFLTHVCRKCGLVPVPVGTPGFSFYRFTAEIFSEPGQDETGAVIPGPGAS